MKLETECELSPPSVCLQKPGVFVGNLLWYLTSFRVALFHAISKLNRQTLSSDTSLIAKPQRKTSAKCRVKTIVHGKKVHASFLRRILITKDHFPVAGNNYKICKIWGK